MSATGDKHDDEVNDQLLVQVVYPHGGVDKFLVMKDCLVWDIKCLIGRDKDIDAESLIIWYQNKELQDLKPLISYGITDESFIKVFVRLDSRRRYCAIDRTEENKVALLLQSIRESQKQITMQLRQLEEEALRSAAETVSGAVTEYTAGETVKNYKLEEILKRWLTDNNIPLPPELDVKDKQPHLPKDSEASHHNSESVVLSDKSDADCKSQRQKPGIQSTKLNCSEEDRAKAAEPSESKTEIKRVFLPVGSQHEPLWDELYILSSDSEDANENTESTPFSEQSEDDYKSHNMKNPMQSGESNDSEEQGEEGAKAAEPSEINTGAIKKVFPSVRSANENKPTKGKGRNGQSISISINMDAASTAEPSEITTGTIKKVLLPNRLGNENISTEDEGVYAESASTFINMEGNRIAEPYETETGTIERVLPAVRSTNEFTVCDEQYFLPCDSEDTDQNAKSAVLSEKFEADCGSHKMEYQVVSRKINDSEEEEAEARAANPSNIKTGTIEKVFHRVRSANEHKQTKDTEQYGQYASAIINADGARTAEPSEIKTGIAKKVPSPIRSTNRIKLMKDKGRYELNESTIKNVDENRAAEPSEIKKVATRMVLPPIRSEKKCDESYFQEVSDQNAKSKVLSEKSESNCKSHKMKCQLQSRKSNDSEEVETRAARPSEIKTGAIKKAFPSARSANELSMCDELYFFPIFSKISDQIAKSTALSEKSEANNESYKMKHKMQSKKSNDSEEKEEEYGAKAAEPSEIKEGTIQKVPPSVRSANELSLCDELYFLPIFSKISDQIAKSTALSEKSEANNESYKMKHQMQSKKSNYSEEKEEEYGAKAAEPSEIKEGTIQKVPPPVRSANELSLCDELYFLPIFSKISDQIAKSTALSETSETNNESYKMKHKVQSKKSNDSEEKEEEYGAKAAEPSEIKEGTIQKVPPPVRSANELSLCDELYFFPSYSKISNQNVKSTALSEKSEANNESYKMKHQMQSKKSSESEEKEEYGARAAEPSEIKTGTIKKVPPPVGSVNENKPTKDNRRYGQYASAIINVIGKEAFEDLLKILNFSDIAKGRIASRDQFLYELSQLYRSCPVSTNWLTESVTNQESSGTETENSYSENLIENERDKKITATVNADNPIMEACNDVDTDEEKEKVSCLLDSQFTEGEKAVEMVENKEKTLLTPNPEDNA